MGFHYDKSKSRSNYPVFSKAMTDDWHLCWAIENARVFFSSPNEGRFEPSLELRSWQLTGNPAKAQSGEFLIFRYELLCPATPVDTGNFLILINLGEKFKRTFIFTL